MRRTILAALLALLIPFAADAQQQERHGIIDEGPDRHLIYTPTTIAWQDGPGSLAPGAQFAVLEGDPSQPGFFTLQIKMPHGFTIAPHQHPGVERVTVLSGAFHLGHGDTVDREAMQRLPVGSHFSIPPKSTHFAITEGETIIQLSSIGPWQIEYVNPADDPRRQQ